MFKQVGERISIKELIVQQIESAILSKQIKPGEKLPSENELCSQFGASRTSVREALQLLSASGLIRIEKGKGIFVEEISSRSVSAPLSKYLQMRLDEYYMLDLVKARQLFEPPIAYEAALKHNDEDVEVLENDIELLKKSERGFKELAKLDMNFHQHLARATRNKVVPLLLEPLQKLMPEVKSTVYANIDQAKESAIEWHDKILEAVINKDPQLAYERMTEHLNIAEEHANKTLKKINENKNKEVSYV